MIFAPFLLIYAIVFLVALAFVFALIEIHVLNYVFVALGLSPGVAFIALLASLFGSYLNIPLMRVEGGPPHPQSIVTNFGVRYRVPTRYARGRTTVAINVGGALVPLAICVYVLAHFPSVIPGAIIGAILGATSHHAAAVAYVSGVMGTLIGADLLNLHRLRELGAPVASIGGAGTFDGIFLTGIVAVLLA